jgi:integrase
MATAKKLPSHNYRVRVYDKMLGKYKSFTAPTKKAAELKALDYLNNLSNELCSAVTFKEATEKYIEAKRAVLSPTTIHGYEVMLRCNMERLHNVLLEKLTVQLAQDWINDLTVNKTAKTVHNVYGLFTAVLTYNDVNFRFNKIKLPAKTKKFKRLPPVDVIVETFKGSEIEIPVMMGLWLGMRASEILGIKLKDIEGDILTINRVRTTVGKDELVKEHAKTYGSNRQLRIPKPILQLIKEKELQPDDFIVGMKQSNIYTRFTRQMKKAGYSISFHDLRHVNASVMAALNIPDIYAMERGGWSNTTTLRSVYQQTFDSTRDRIDKQIDNYFSEIYDTKYDTKAE